MGMILILIISSCKMTYIVRNQNQALTEISAIPCGSMKSALEGRGNSKFTYRQKIIVDSPVMLFADSIKIFYNNQLVPSAITGLGKNRSGVFKIDHGDFDLEWYFSLPEGVFDGDTIKIIQHSFIDCANERHSTSDMIYTFKNPVRIQGVNVP